jgi:hypothetical protein
VADTEVAGKPVHGNDRGIPTALLQSPNVLAGRKARFSGPPYRGDGSFDFLHFRATSPTSLPRQLDFFDLLILSRDRRPEGIETK